MQSGRRCIGTNAEGGGGICIATGRKDRIGGDFINLYGFFFARAILTFGRRAGGGGQLLGRGSRRGGQEQQWLQQEKQPKAPEKRHDAAGRAMHRAELQKGCLNPSWLRLHVVLFLHWSGLKDKGAASSSTLGLSAQRERSLFMSGWRRANGRGLELIGRRRQRGIGWDPTWGRGLARPTNSVAPSRPTSTLHGRGGIERMRTGPTFTPTGRG